MKPLVVVNKFNARKRRKVEPRIEFNKKNLTLVAVLFLLFNTYKKVVNRYTNINTLVENKCFSKTHVYAKSLKQKAKVKNYK